MKQCIVFLVDGRNRPLHPTNKLDMVNRWLRQRVARTVKFIGKVMVVQVTKKLNPSKDQPEYWLGIDPGDTIGICLIRKTGSKIKILFLAELVTRSRDIVKLMKNRLMYRTTRRYFRRKRIRRRGLTPKHRPARFDNRRRPDGWLTPSVRHFLESHKSIINRIAQYVPDINISLEYAKFDIQKLINPDIEGEEYQHGKLLGHANLRDYVLHRDKYQCHLCHGHNQLQIHHIIPRSRGGKDHPDNLITLCSSCHKKVHNDNVLLKQLQNNIKIKRSFSSTSRLNIIIPFLRQWLIDEFGYDHVWLCTGSDTRVIRKQIGLIKTHCNDAYCIAVNKIVKYDKNIDHDMRPIVLTQFIQKRQHNRRLKHYEHNRLYYLVKDGQKQIKIAINRNGDSESFHNVYDSKILPMLKQGYRLKVVKGLKGYRKTFSHRKFKEGAIVRYNDKCYVIKGKDRCYARLYNHSNINRRNMDLVYPFGGLKCI